MMHKEAQSVDRISIKMEYDFLDNSRFPVTVLVIERSIPLG
jgi:hypothetical protein